MAKVQKQELGKGIRALLGNSNVTPTKGDDPVKDDRMPIKLVQVDSIEINPFQPRSEFDQEALEELSESIKTFGLIQPLTLRKLDASTYQLIAGERRLRASKLAGLSELPAYIREANDQEMLEMALVENIQRAQLNAIEVAISYQRLIDECNLTHESLSERIGKKRSTVTNYLRLLKLPPAIQQALKADKISMGHARALVGLENQEYQLVALHQVLSKELSVRDTEKLVRELGHSPKESSKKQAALPPIYQQTVDHLSKELGTKVEMKRKSSGVGTITFHFHSDHDLNEILDYFERN